MHSREEKNKYWPNLLKDTFSYCYSGEEIYLEGMRDSAYNNQEHAYIIYEVQKCHDEIRITKPLDPSCDPETT